jgi:hypothetical protein
MQQILPVPFRGQTLEKRPKIIANVLNARSIACKIVDEMNQFGLPITEGGRSRLRLT